MNPLQKAKTASVALYTKTHVIQPLQRSAETNIQNGQTTNCIFVYSQGELRCSGNLFKRNTNLKKGIKCVQGKKCLKKTL